ncbi:MAG: GNAT family protein [Herpetosiphon sp.]
MSPSAVLQKGSRIALRTPSEADCAAFCALMEASTRFHRGLVDAPRTTKAFAAYLERCGRADMCGMLICMADTGTIVGYANVSQIVGGAFHSAYLGYTMGAPYVGQGYMSAAMPLILRQAFMTLRLHRLEANIQPSNVPSIRVVRRAGFTLEGYSRRYLKVGGRWRDHERWAILTEDWAAHRRATRQVRITGIACAPVGPGTTDNGAKGSPHGNDGQ